MPLISADKMKVRDKKETQKNPKKTKTKTKRTKG